MTLPDDVIVYTAHGAGSACGKNMSKENISTIGEQKKTNYALKADMSEDEFIKEVTDGLLPPPAYFGMNMAMNRSGIKSFESILKQGMRKINAIKFEAVT
jgi:hydroxyacylglutathione hydrolase